MQQVEVAATAGSAGNNELGDPSSRGEAAADQDPRQVAARFLEEVMLEENPAPRDRGAPPEGGSSNSSTAGVADWPVAGRHGADGDREPEVDQIPVEMGALRLMDRGISQLPPWVRDSARLCLGIKVLWLGKNRLSELPPGIYLMQRLEKLNAINNRIVALRANVLPASLQILELNNNQISRVQPGFFAQLPRLRHFDLCANLLTVEGLGAAGAAELGSCTQLRYVDISSNRFAVLPDAMLGAASLFELRVSLNPIIRLPPIDRFTYLESIIMAHCGLTAIAPEVIELPCLHILDAGRNKLRVLPDNFKSPLRELRLCRNELQALPASVERCADLVEVDLAWNCLSAFPESVVALPLLERLFLQHNLIPKLPKFVSRLASRGEGFAEMSLEYNQLQAVNGVHIDCRELYIGHNPLRSLDGFKKLRARQVSLAVLGLTSLPPLTGVKVLNAPGNELREVDMRSLAGCTRSMRVLNLSQNRLTSLPEAIASLAGLTELLLAYNQLVGLPDSLARLHRLTVLNLGGNNLASVPAVTLEIESLEWLHLGNNRIEALPVALSRLDRLQSLLLNDNRLASLDVILPDSLIELDLSHNEITSLPPTFALPNGSLSWGSKLKRPRETRGPGSLFWFLCGRNPPVVHRNKYEQHSHPRAEERTVVAPLTEAPNRIPHKPPKNMQPFRMYIHGNPMPLPPPHLLAHCPGRPPPLGIVPLPLGRHPRGSGCITIDEYDGAVWPSEAALHLELLQPQLQRSESLASRVRVGVAEMMGRRLRMEDSVVVQRCFRGRSDEAFFALFDAHAGSDVAEEGARQLGAELARQLGDGPLPPRDAVGAAMEAAFLQLNERLKPLQVVGGAVAVALLLHIESPTSGTLHCANVGDSRAVLCKERRGVRLSRDFKPFDPDEYERIQALGGFVSLRDGGRVCDDLALTRALGDLHLAKYIEPRAHLQVEELDFQANPFFIVGCDGVWDVMSDQEAVDAVRVHHPDYHRAAAALRDLAFVHGSTDNISALVVDLTQI